MAEILGTVASAIAVAEVGLKVGGTVLKLRELWKEVQEVPEKIQDLMREMEIWEPILSEIESNFEVDPTAGSNTVTSQPFDSSIGRMSSSFCREALRDLQELVKELSNEISSAKTRKRGIAKVKVLLKKDDLKKSQGRLKRAFRLLQSAQMGYVMALAKSQSQMVVQINQQTTTISTTNGPLSAGTSQPEAVPIVQRQEVVTKKSANITRIHYIPWTGPTYFGSIVARSFKENTSSSGLTWIARFQPPKWLSQKAWELSAQQACRGWQINLISVNMVPNDSPVWKFVKNDDWGSLRESFREGRASPYDCNMHGRTVYDIACIAGSLSVILGLLQTEEIVANSEPALNAANLYWPYRPELLTEDRMQPLLAHGFVDRVADDIVGLEPSEIPVFVYVNLAYSPPIEGFFELLLRTYLPGWDRLRPSEKALLVCRWGTAPWPANSVRRLVRPYGHIQREDMRKWNNDGVSLLHWISGLFGNSRPRSWRSEHLPRWRVDWQQLLAEIINVADDLHLVHSLLWAYCPWDRHRTEVPMTFLSCFLGSDMEGLANVGEKESSKARLNMLLGVLKSCGVDLEAFGRIEFEIWESEYGATHMATVPCVKVLDWNWKTRRAIGHCWPPVWRADLISAIYYGPTPEDWSIEYDRYRNWPAVFWKMVENPLQAEVMPGAWAGDDSDDDSD